MAFALALLLLFPAGVVGVQLAQVADSKGCPARLVPSRGPVKVRLFVDQPVLGHSVEPRILAGYLADRLGRAVQITGLEERDATGFRMAAALQPWSGEILALLSLTPSFPNVPTSHGMVEALGFATPGTACAYVSFVPQEGKLCRVGGSLGEVQPAYAYLAHEVGHLMGLSHTGSGLMGKGVFDLCSGDVFSADQRAAVARWGA